MAPGTTQHPGPLAPPPPRTQGIHNWWELGLGIYGAWVADSWHQLLHGQPAAASAQPTAEEAQLLATAGGQPAAWLLTDAGQGPGPGRRPRCAELRLPCSAESVE
jgi:hypothetical protein